MKTPPGPDDGARRFPRCPVPKACASYEGVLYVLFAAPCLRLACLGRFAFRPQPAPATERPAR